MAHSLSVPPTTEKDKYGTGRSFESSGGLTKIVLQSLEASVFKENIFHSPIRHQASGIRQLLAISQEKPQADEAN
jgi:hypothetical protein